MNSRRQFLVALGSVLAALVAAAWLTRSRAPVDASSPRVFPVQKSDAEWARTLTAEQYRVLRRHHTERPFTSPLNHQSGNGTFICAGCGNVLFASTAKYDSGTGWPSFREPLGGAIGTALDRSLLMVRMEVHCARCGGHLGHVFSDGPPPLGLRYCINGAALAFRPSAAPH